MIFDRYVTVDWSASSRPKSGPDSIWICVLDGDDAAVTLNVPTRAEAETVLRHVLTDAVARRKRTLVGFDFPLGYPAGLGTALRLGDPAWLAVWRYLLENVRDGRDNKNNRFEVAATINASLTQHAFWGCPPSQRSDRLSPRRDCARYRIEPTNAGVCEWRSVESLLRRRGKHPHSLWKLLGVGSVGSQSLTGIPVVARLKREHGLRGVTKIWPFETFVPDLPKGRPAIVHAEVWPSLADRRYVNARCKDEMQVISLSEDFRDLDRDSRLAALFAAGDSPSASEEGWILGVVP